MRSPFIACLGLLAGVSSLPVSQPQNGLLANSVLRYVADGAVTPIASAVGGLIPIDLVPVVDKRQTVSGNVAGDQLAADVGKGSVRVKTPFKFPLEVGFGDIL